MSGVKICLIVNKRDLIKFTSSSNNITFQCLHYRSNKQSLESLVIILNAPPSHTYTLLLSSNLFTSLFTLWQINFSVAVQLTLTLLFVKQGTTLYLISTGSIENIYTNGQSISCCNSPPSGRSVFIIVTIFHCWNINMSCFYLHEYMKW